MIKHGEKMKICPTCSSTTFDDMAVCYGCLQVFDGTTPVLSYLPSQQGLSDDSPGGELIEKSVPGKPGAQPYSATNAARFHVVLSDIFGYEIYLQKEEGKELTVGCARDNNIVLPHTEARRHLLRLYYSQGEIWAQDKGSQQKALIGDTPLTGTRCLKQGTVLQVGEARIELVAS